MSYICGKSRNKIVHSMQCRCVKMIPDKNKKYFSTSADATKSGYVQCRCCNYIQKYLKPEEKKLKEYCGKNGLYFFYNPADGSLDVISKTGKWKIIVNGHRHQIWLYHKNDCFSEQMFLVPGYHSQKARSESLMGYMNYIVEHDRFRDENPLYTHQMNTNTIKGSKKWKKNQRRADCMGRKCSIRYVYNILDNLAAGNIAF